MIMEKVYKMNGYDLHLIPTNKFKNIKTIGTNLTSLKFLYPDILIPRYSN